MKLWDLFNVLSIVFEAYLDAITRVLQSWLEQVAIDASTYFVHIHEDVVAHWPHPNTFVPWRNLRCVLRSGDSGVHSTVHLPIQCTGTDINPDSVMWWAPYCMNHRGVSFHHRWISDVSLFPEFRAEGTCAAVLEKHVMCNVSNICRRLAVLQLETRACTQCRWGHANQPSAHRRGFRA
jgi:hypothetical protein